LEGLASPGSGQPRVGEQVRGKLGYHSDDMGEYDVNNIACPMLGFCLRPEAIADPLSMSVPRPPCRFSESPTTPRPTGGDPAEEPVASVGIFGQSGGLRRDEFNVQHSSRLDGRQSKKPLAAVALMRVVTNTHIIRVVVLSNHIGLTNIVAKDVSGYPSTVDGTATSTATSMSDPPHCDFKLFLVIWALSRRNRSESRLYHR
jgi:hypothetical protein